MRDLLVLLCLAVAQLTISAQAQVYTNVIYTPSSSSGSGSTPANSYINRCTNPPSAVTNRFSACANNGFPLAGLRVNGNLVEFKDRITVGAVVGPGGTAIADDPEQFYWGNLTNSLSQAGISCSTFYSFAEPYTGSTPAGMNQGCARGLLDFMGSNSAERTHRLGSCTSKGAGTWYSDSPATCAITSTLLCVCSFMHAPTTSPTLPSQSPSKAPSTSKPTRSPSTSKPTKSPAAVTSSPTRAPTKEPTAQPSKAPSFPTQQPTSLSPTMKPTSSPSPSNVISNVIYSVRSGEPKEYKLSNYLSACATIPTDVRTNFPACQFGIPLASIKQNGQITNFNEIMTEGNVVGPYGFVIADTVSQFYSGVLTRSLSAAEVGCSSRFFSATESTGLASAEACSTSTTADFFSSSSDSKKFRYGSCSSTAAGWFSSSTTDCDEDANFLCVCKVFPTSSPTSKPTVSPTPPTPYTPSPTTGAPTNLPTRSPTKTPTPRPSKNPTLRPTRLPTTLQPTYAPTAFSVIYTGTDSYKLKDGVDKFFKTCSSIPDHVVAAFPECVNGLPFASLVQDGRTSHLVDIVKNGPVYGANGVMLADNPLHFYTSGLNASLNDAGITCNNNYFFSGTLPNGMVGSGCEDEGSFLEDDDKKISFHYGSCTSTAANWFSDGSRNCDVDDNQRPALLCYCRVVTSPRPTAVTGAPTNELSTTDGSASNSDLEVTAAAAWGLVGVLSAVIIAAGVVTYVGKYKKRPMTNAMPTEQSTQLAMRTNTDLE